MFSPSKHQPLDRFTGLATIYDRYRPTYPSTLIEWCKKHYPINESILDVGCGTGIFTQQLVDEGFQVIGVEPNAEMLNLARSRFQNTSRSLPFLQCPAERIDLEDDSISGIVVAQAFHWFEATKALQEFARLLRPRCWVALIWNEADESDSGTKSYWDLMRDFATAPEVVKDPHSFAGKPLLDSPWFENQSVVKFPNQQSLDEEGFLGRAFSASFAPKESSQVKKFTEALKEVFSRQQENGRMTLRYTTISYTGQKKAPG
jgi:SAM-dependent methyltransferase